MRPIPGMLQPGSMFFPMKLNYELVGHGAGDSPTWRPLGARTV